MKIQLEITEDTLKRLVLTYIQAKLGDVDISEKDILIEVKSKQNYRSEWEIASFRARVDKFTKDEF